MPRDLTIDIDQLAELNFDWIGRLKRPVSGTYRNATPATSGSILELRVDVDGRRPQERLSGDLYTHFTFCGIPITFFTGSFVVEDVTEGGDSSAIVLSGPVIYYGDPTRTTDSIVVRIPRVGYFSPPAAACIEWFTNSLLVRSYASPKVSEYFRVATLEVDRFQGTVFPPELDPALDPSPSGLPSEVGVRETFLRSGVDLAVALDDVLNDPDSGDAGDNWSEAELHDLMEDRFDQFGNTLKWNLYAVIVPKFGDPGYNSGYYGTMFDWGGWQAGDAFLRQGCAIAETAIRGRENGTLYDTSDKKDRLILQTLIHEIGHAFNLPHTWERTVNSDGASNSFMNYPWGYTGNGGGETQFWTDFRWEFDNEELIWMRHADRNDVIFGGRDWIGNNLTADLRPALEQPGTPLVLEIDAPDVFDIGVPVQLGLRLHNTTTSTVSVVDRLQPEEGMLRVIIERPDGEIVEFVPPVRRLMAPPETRPLQPGDVAAADIAISYGAKGHQFSEPGEYIIRVYFPCFPLGFLATATRRIRIAHPTTRASEELAHLLTGKEASTFLFYGGSGSAETKDRIIEAAERFARSDPAAVRHIAAALGRDAARSHKRIEVRKGKKVVVRRPPERKAAARWLAEALEPLPRGYGQAAFAPLAESRLVGRLVDTFEELGQHKEATAALDAAVKRLKTREGGAAAIAELRGRARSAKPATKKTKKTRKKK
jgi:hypothetical protein